MTPSEPTSGQLERSISQQLQAFYREKIGQRPTKAICQIFDDSLVTVLESTIAPVEQTLLDAGQGELAQTLRSELHRILKPQLKTLVEEITQVPVLSILMDSEFERGSSTVVAILASIPPVRDLEAIPKVRRPATPEK